MGNEDTIFRFTDVGGQREYRRQWMRMFDNCAAVIFLISMSDYDQTLEEEGGRGDNCLLEALGLFKSLIDMLPDKSFILFMNKEDLLREKASTSPMQNFHRRYDPNFK